MPNRVTNAFHNFTDVSGTQEERKARRDAREEARLAAKANHPEDDLKGESRSRYVGRVVLFGCALIGIAAFGAGIDRVRDWRHSLGEDKQEAEIIDWLREHNVFVDGPHDGERVYYEQMETDGVPTIWLSARPEAGGQKLVYDFAFDEKSVTQSLYYFVGGGHSEPRATHVNDEIQIYEDIIRFGYSPSEMPEN